MNKTKQKKRLKVDDNNIIVVNKTIVRCTGQNDFGHPAVYLKIKEKGQVICPYCSKIFKKN